MTSSDLLLTLIVGSIKPFQVVLYDQDDKLEDLTGATEATLVIRESATSEDNILFRSTSDNTLDLSIEDATLEGSLTQEEADDLPIGDYIGSVAVLFPDGWQISDPFIVRIQPKIAETS